MTEFEFIEAEKARFPVKAMCRTLKASKSGYYEWRERGPSARLARREELAKKVVAVHEESRCTYGSPRVREQLVQEGEVVSEKTIASVMREIQLVGRSKRRFKVTTDSRFTELVAPNLLQRNFVATCPNEVWVTDVTALPVVGGWVYLAAIVDLYARRVVGWAMSDSNDTALALDALGRAVRARNPKPGLLHHSDRGSPYGSHAYVAELERLDFRRSMSRKGDCWDNAVAESFFSTLEYECVRGRTFQNLSRTMTEIGGYIDDFYNPKRLHSTIGFTSPIAHELRFQIHQQAA